MNTLIVDHTHEAAAFLPLTEDRKVDARSLHEWLGVATEFRKWFGRIVEDYGFEEGESFVPALSQKSTGGRPKKDYLLTLDVAKEIAMIGNTPKGKATRRYFIAAEKAAAKMASGKVAEGRKAFFDAQSEFGAMERRIVTLLEDRVAAILTSLPGATWKDASGRVWLVDDLTEDHMRRIVKGDYADGAVLERIQTRLRSFGIDRKLQRQAEEDEARAAQAEKCKALLAQVDALLSRT